MQGIELDGAGRGLEVSEYRVVGSDIDGRDFNLPLQGGSSSLRPHLALSAADKSSQSPRSGIHLSLLLRQFRPQIVTKTILILGNVWCRSPGVS
jgi:hypothetical protein